MTNRYSGKPLLRLLECFVLWSIGELGEKETTALEAMTPKLRSIYGAQGSWQEVLAAALHMPQDTPRRIREAWAKHLENQAPISAQEFAQVFVDQNFAP
jgi:hypothetical protein